MGEWTDERHEAAKARCEVAADDECQVDEGDFPDALAEIERLRKIIDNTRSACCIEEH